MGERVASGSFVERCEALGVAAWTFDAGGAKTGVTHGEGALGRVLRSRPMLDAARHLAEDALRSASGFVEDESEGAAFVGMKLEYPSGDVAGVAMMPGPRFGESVLFDRAWRDAGIDPVEALRAVKTIGVFDERSAGMVRRALAMMARDLAELGESRVKIDGFASQLSEAFDTIDVLYTIGNSMRDPSRPEAFLKSLCERLHAALNFEWIAARFSPQAGREIGRPALGDAVFSAGRTPRTESLAGRELVGTLGVGEGTRVFEHVAGLSEDGRSQVLVSPLDRAGKTLAALIAGGKHGKDPAVSSGDIQLLEAATGFLGAFLDNVALFEEQRRLFMGTLHALTAAIDAKDRYTRGHSERVAYVAEQIAARLGLAPEHVERVRIAGLVHDVGKIGVPESVLTKAGSLTSEEFELIKQHPTIGHRIIQGIPQLADVLPGVLHHHERWDGRGYPAKLSGESIPLWARIIAVADAFDAMSSNRSYRPAMERARVLSEMNRCAGTQLDPAMVAAFLRIDLAVYDDMARRHADTDPISAAARAA